VSTPLLNTREAARFLRVSEASIRRWTDAGILPVQRVGRRNERRFTEDTLRAFLRQGEQAAAPDTERRASVSLRGTAIQVPCHLATFYDSDAGRLRLSVPFISQGLKLGETCFVVASGHSLDAQQDALSGAGIDVEAEAVGGRLVFISKLPPTATESIAEWERLWERALAGGPGSIRVVGDMALELKTFKVPSEMILYEASFDTMAKRYPVAVLCQYDVRAFDGVTLLSAIKTHPDIYNIRLGNLLA
jgi:excisionase family DNA binding protein